MQSPQVQNWGFLYTQGNFIQRIDYDTNSNAIYIGWANPGTPSSEASWRIIQNTYDSSNRLIVSAFPEDLMGNSSPAFSFIWDNRDSYVYG